MIAADKVDRVCVCLQQVVEISHIRKPGGMQVRLFPLLCAEMSRLCAQLDMKAPFGPMY